MSKSVNHHKAETRKKKARWKRGADEVFLKKNASTLEHLAQYARSEAKRITDDELHCRILFGEPSYGEGK